MQKKNRRRTQAVDRLGILMKLPSSRSLCFYRHRMLVHLVAWWLLTWT